jgi:hypothetical protein
MNLCLICRSEGHDVSAHTEKEREEWKAEQVSKIQRRKEERLSRAYELVVSDIKERPENIDLILDNAGNAAFLIRNRYMKQLVSNPWMSRAYSKLARESE